MKDLSQFSKIMLALKPVDFRKQAHSLALIVQESLQYDPLNEKSLFAFINKRKSAVKFLYWDTTGYALWWKTLEEERFRWPKSQEEVLKITAKDLRLILEGVDLMKLTKHKKFSLN